MHITLHHYLLLAAALFTLGLLTLVLKRNAIAMLMGIELMLNAANLNLVAFARFTPDFPAAQAHVTTLLIILLAAAEAAVALAIFLNFHRLFHSVDPDAARTLGEEPASPIDASLA